MDVGQSIVEVLSSGAVVGATAQIIKGLKARLSALEQIASDQKHYIQELRTDFKELSTIKTAFIHEIESLSSTYQEHAKKTYGGIIELKEKQITELTAFVKLKNPNPPSSPKKATIQKTPETDTKTV